MFNRTMSNQGFIKVLYTAALLTVFHLPAHAAPALGAIRISSIAEQEIQVVNKNGQKEVSRVPVETAVPGDEIIYTTTFENIINKPTGNIVITNPVPNDTTFQDASGANTDITFSVDGGKQYATPDKLVVKTQNDETRAAVPADYTHVRWVYKGELGVGKISEISFRTVIK
ncbi:MAG: putative repeat protein (TIGR01451 family) [Candidatus Azotimanducaceae bacterium]|jgi:uncharacterized repeat protein (TIGR01451 family)